MGPMNPLTLSTMIVLTLTLLFSPLIFYVFREAKSSYETAERIKTAVALAFVASLMPISFYFFAGSNVDVVTWDWIYNDTFKMTLSFAFDAYSLVFIPVGLFVTWSILEFSLSYMKDDINIARFFMYLLVFLLAMMILVTADNLYQLFIGWEGVGMMSFLLIGWWHARADANTAALQAVAYNRIGDIAFLFSMAFFMQGPNTWQIHQLHRLSEISPDMDLTPGLIAVIIAATGKSAQFGLHPWLPAAMEGPTPVSSLLHSSTMVVAGIFLLIRFSPVLAHSPVALTVCLWLGALTTLYTATCALTQNDLKKIIAFSTSSQLGLMMVTIGLNQPHLAFLHICTHAFFKAMLFLCAGSIIHSVDNEQDIRKMGGMFRLAPFTSGCLTIGSLALTGTPFLAGFFSKDAIIEALNTSHLNAWALFLTLVATAFTAIYSVRIIYYVAMGNPRILPLSPINENDPHIINPLKRLAWGSIAGGLLLALNIIPVKTPIMTMHMLLKLGALAVTMVGLFMALELAALAAKQFKPSPFKSPYMFSNMLGFFPTVVHRSVPKMTMSMGQKYAGQAVDQSWLEKVGPKGMAASNKPLISTTSNLQRGLLFSHLAMFMLTTTLAIIMGFR
nr:NADH dehydrogenase subunit 5 [Halichoeres maculipinna]